jgi:ppGpp synthetase/RelA/SpoT-type nucleotidyltranferase
MPETFELQVRTLFMHAWAEPQHDLGYKGPGDLTKLQKKRLAWVAASAWGADHELEGLWAEVGLKVGSDPR